MSKKEIWSYLYKELGKIDTTLRCYDKIFENIEINNNSYNQIFQLILDNMSSYIILSLAKYFDKRRDCISLYKFNEIDTEEVDKIELKAQQYKDFRHSRIAHLNKNIEHKSNFRFLDNKGTKEIKQIVKAIRKVLRQISKLNGYKEDYVLDWPGIESSLDSLFIQLKNGRNDFFYN